MGAREMLEDLRSLPQTARLYGVEPHFYEAMFPELMANIRMASLGWLSWKETQWQGMEQHAKAML